MMRHIVDLTEDLRVTRVKRPRIGKGIRAKKKKRNFIKMPRI